MRICLVAMPWQALELPSLAVALLRARLAETRPDDTVTEFHACLRWAEFLLEQTEGEITPADYLRVAEGGIFQGLGDWVFSGTLYGQPNWAIGRLRRYAARHHVEIDHVLRMRPYADEFIDRTAREILATGPELVGFTTTFMQNVPSLALAQKLKHLAPELYVLFGGGNCDGPMGHALHRNHAFVDLVVRGEGELALPALLDRISRGDPLSDVPGVCWWNGDESIANEEPKHPIPPDAIPRPNFGGWQQELERSLVNEYVEPQLVLEGARGCWWGEKHQCTFCGLNGSFIQFRSRPAERLWSDLQNLVERHRILDVVMVDNILDMTYFRSLLPKIAAAGWDLRLHYEVKANLQPDHVALLAAAGVVHLQPGIENLSTRVLGLMDKGATGVINVRLLRECEDHSFTLSWNYLYGFPGEEERDYEAIISQFRALSHLQPPDAATRITLERFSPNFERPELGFAQRRPAEFYDHVYALPEKELHDLVYMFDSPPRGIGGDTERLLHEAVRTWQERYPSSRLLVRNGASGNVVIDDRRASWPHRTYTLSGWQAVAYRALERGRTMNSLGRVLAAEGYETPTEAVGEWLRELTGAGLVFVEDSTYVALATSSAPVKLLGTAGT